MATLLARFQEMLVGMIDRGEVDYKDPEAEDFEQMRGLWKKSSQRLRERFEKLDDAGWQRPVKFLIGGKVVNEMPTSDLMWGFLHDMIHHRGQLTAYIRPMGGNSFDLWAVGGRRAGVEAIGEVAMNDREFFLKKWEQEHPAFLRVIQALPPDRLDYRPHPKSRSAAELVCLLTHESNVCCDLVDTGLIDWKEPKPSTHSEMVDAYERSHRELTDRLRKLDDADWERPGRFVEEGHLVMEGPQREIFWLLFLDAVHHRGQLSSYIRPMGGKVPSIYGPSGDAAPA